MTARKNPRNRGSRMRTPQKKGGRSKDEKIALGGGPKQLGELGGSEETKKKKNCSSASGKLCPDHRKRI